MTLIDSAFLEDFRKTVSGWVDERMITQQELWALGMFNLYLVNLAEADGWTYDGHSLKVGQPFCCLTVKATLEGTPVVVFTSARTPTACVRIFVRKLEEGLLEWQPDRYR